MPKEKAIDLLFELVRNSKRSDRELAKVIDVSQPTITRMRKSLETLNLIRAYTVIPALDKLGFEVVALSFVSINVPHQEGAKFIIGWVSDNPKVLFASSGEGLGGKTLLLVSVHRDFSGFSEFNSELRSALGSRIISMESFLVSLKSDVIKHLSLSSLEKT